MVEIKKTHGGSRPGAGRKPDADPKMLVNVRLTASEKDLIKKAAETKGETPAAFMRRAILEAINK